MDLPNTFDMQGIDPKKEGSSLGFPQIWDKSSLAFEPLLTAGVIAESDGNLILQGPPALCEETLSLCTNQELVFPD